MYDQLPPGFKGTGRPFKYLNANQKNSVTSPKIKKGVYACLVERITTFPDNALITFKSLDRNWRVQLRLPVQVRVDQRWSLVYGRLKDELFKACGATSLDECKGKEVAVAIDKVWIDSFARYIPGGALANRRRFRRFPSILRGPLSGIIGRTPSGEPTDIEVYGEQVAEEIHERGISRRVGVCLF